MSYQRKHLVIECKCGKTMHFNVYKKHVLGSKCPCDNDAKRSMLDFLDLIRAHKFAWLKKDGLEAVSNTRWYDSVISGELSIDDWTFETPRPRGSMPPSKIKSMSEARRGTDNPGCKNRIHEYSVEDIKRSAHEYLERMEHDPDLTALGLHPFLSQLYPDYRYQFANLHKEALTTRGDNYLNRLLADLVDMSISEWIRFTRLRRGKKIQKAQLASEKFRRVASKTAANMCSRFRVTKPQLYLFLMIRSIDPSAKLEQKLFDKTIHRYRSYDIYSPKLRALFEMHGRVWHDSTKTTPRLRELAVNNEKNDLLKKSIAERNGFQYIVFWDDECDRWSETLLSLYGTEAISYERAKDLAVTFKR